MTPALSRRIGHALSVGNATPRQRAAVIDAARSAETFEDLTTSVQRLVAELETHRGRRPQPPHGRSHLDIGWARIRADIRALSLQELPDHEDELDVDSLALVWALTELAGEWGESLRAGFDPAKHPRIPKGQPGAGRFLSMVERVKARLEMHLKGGGDGDPFEGFSREQLRNAAKARGLSLKKGATRDEIAKLLLDNLSPSGVLEKKNKFKGQAGKATKMTAKTPVGSAIDHIPSDLRKLIFSSYKSQPTGQLLSSHAHASYDNLHAIAHVHGAKVPGGLSVGQVAKVVDEQLALNQKITNQHLLGKKIEDWLATSHGAVYVKINPKPNQEIVESLTGKVSLPSGIKLKTGEKVQRIAGPGQYKAALKASDFKRHTAAQMRALQDKHKADNGITWTSGQRAALVNYTGGGYTAINNYLRGQDKTTSPGVQKMVVEAQSAMLPLQEHTLLVRGVGWDQFPVGFRSPDKVHELVGKTVQEPAFMSTSVAGSGGEFSGPVSLKIEAPAGTYGVFVKELSLHPSENELILAAGNKFRIISVTDAAYGTVVRMRVVTPK